MSGYNREIAAQILEWIAEHGLGLKGACEKMQIPRRTVRNWAATNPEFAAGLAQARRESYEHWADQMLEIADQMEGCQSVAEVMACRARLETRKWLLAKLNPDRYGDRVQLTGKDGRDLIPANAEAAIPRLLQVLHVLLPDMVNSELFNLATEMSRKLTEIEGPKAGGNGADGEEH